MGMHLNYLYDTFVDQKYKGEEKLCKWRDITGKVWNNRLREHEAFKEANGLCALHLLSDAYHDHSSQRRGPFPDQQSHGSAGVSINQL